MKTVKNTIYLVLLALMPLSLASCDNQSSQAVFAPDELPKIFIAWVDAQIVTEGEVLTFNPIVSPSDGAIFSWKINGKEVATTQNFEYTIGEDDEDFTIRFDVSRNGVATHRESEILISRPFTAKQYNKKTIAFVDASTALMSDIVWDNLTHIVLQSGTVASETVTFAGLNRPDFDISRLIAMAHRNGIFVLLDVAGPHGFNGVQPWGAWPFYEAIAGAYTRASIISEVMETIEEFGFDGINIYFDRQSVAGAWSADEAVNIQAFFNELIAAMPAENLTLPGQPFFFTQSLYQGWVAWGAAPHVGLPRTDWYHVFSFGFEDLVVEPHNSMDQFILETDGYTWIGVPADRLVPLVPAYGMLFRTGGAGLTWGNYEELVTRPTWREIIRDYPNAYQVNTLPVGDGLFFDGFPHIDAKSARVIERGFAGMGLWKADFDTTNPNTSLLRRMNQALGN